jgi:hypothetical protein
MEYRITLNKRGEVETLCIISEDKLEVSLVLVGKFELVDNRQ